MNGDLGGGDGDGGGLRLGPTGPLSGDQLPIPGRQRLVLSAAAAALDHNPCPFSCLWRNRQGKRHWQTGQTPVTRTPTSGGWTVWMVQPQRSIADGPRCCRCRAAVGVDSGGTHAKLETRQRC
mgnify:CR=1 FL=1